MNEQLKNTNDSRVHELRVLQDRYNRVKQVVEVENDVLTTDQHGSGANREQDEAEQLGKLSSRGQHPVHQVRKELGKLRRDGGRKRKKL